MNSYPHFGRTGVVRAFSCVQPSVILLMIVCLFSFSFMIHSVSVLVSPLIVTRLLVLLLFCCSIWVAHLQLSGEYPFSLSTLSIDRPSLFSPMSLKKFSNLSHRLQIVIPLPPYHFQSCDRLFKHLCRILSHVWYSGLYLIPCTVFRFIKTSKSKHPHDFVPLETKLSLNMNFSTPHSHLQNQYVLSFLPSLLCSNRIAVSLLNFLPEMSLTIFGNVAGFRNKSKQMLYGD